jgi:hypothetical protein
LDLTLTNLKEYYASPIKLSPFGLSDHVTVKVLPLSRTTTSKCKSKTSIKTRDIRPTKRLAMSTYLEAVDIQTLKDNEISCEEKFVSTGMNPLLPMKRKTIIANEPP